MSEHFNKLSPAETERLSILIEECGEVIQAACKVLRHGYEDYSPFDEDKLPNRHMLENELGHLMNAVQMLAEPNDVNAGKITAAKAIKAASIGRWLHHQGAQS